MCSRVYMYICVRTPQPPWACLYSMCARTYSTLASCSEQILPKSRKESQTSAIRRIIYSSISLYVNMRCLLSPTSRWFFRIFCLIYFFFIILIINLNCTHIGIQFYIKIDWIKKAKGKEWIIPIIVYPTWYYKKNKFWNVAICNNQCSSSV